MTLTGCGKTRSQWQSIQASDSTAAIKRSRNQSAADSLEIVARHCPDVGKMFDKLIMIRLEPTLRN